ncbi:PH domain-containing protein [Brachybacterium sp. EF45031]|uniref:PH domain-containing protein n=1 Tax=Brachybacterium sillae TaxID=2810536 RepID=UPI00217D596A|nr:PH domain-containing protein [Brachybacterium sillae]MCS6712601.1 PH domain-containing protein [Brachybacterium sillae]
MSTVVHRRTHPLTPLVNGWKVLAAVAAVVGFQNIPDLLEEFTWTRALIALGALAVLTVLAVLLGMLSWWRTTYAVGPGGVELHSGLLTRTERSAPRERITAVSVERPLMARLLGVAKVRVELTGGEDSHLDIDYVSSADAERLRRHILRVAAVGDQDAAAEDHAGVVALGGSGDATGSASPSAADPTSSPLRERLDHVLHDGVTDGELLAGIPTTRLLHSLLRDVGFLLMCAALLLVGLAPVVTMLTGAVPLSWGVILPLLPAVLAVPKLVLDRVEKSWGFVSRTTPAGLRLRRGLFSTRTDNLAPDRVQTLTLRRPLLWRGPGWVDLSVATAGIEDGEDGADAILPVGTEAELRATLEHVMTPLGTPDDTATLLHLLTAPARELPGLHPPHRWQWIARRTCAAVVLPEAVVLRSGLLTCRLQIVPSDRLQGVRWVQGPVDRRQGLAHLEMITADGGVDWEHGSAADAERLHAELARRAAVARRYRDRERWARPVASLPSAASTPTTAVPEETP